MTNAELIQLECAQDEAQNLYNELLGHKLEVCLSGPIDETGRKMRLVQGRNPAWYRVMFEQHWNGKKGKKSRSDVRRVRVLDALDRLKRGEYRNCWIYDLMCDEIKDRLFNGYYIEEY